MDTIAPPRLPRGIRNHNPGNIRHGAPWDGLAAKQEDRDFCTFTSPTWGLRALMKVLLTYHRRHGLDTVAEIIARWAPPSENNTSAYVRAVAEALGVAPTAQIRPTHPEVLVRLAQAICRHECGVAPTDRPSAWYDEATWQAAALLALGVGSGGHE